jgi:hypothetical protein
MTPDIIPIVKTCAVCLGGWQKTLPLRPAGIADGKKLLLCGPLELRKAKNSSFVARWDGGWQNPTEMAVRIQRMTISSKNRPFLPQNRLRNDGKLV